MRTEKELGEFLDARYRNALALIDRERMLLILQLDPRRRAGRP